MTTNAVEERCEGPFAEGREVAFEGGAVGEAGEEVVMCLERQMAVHQAAGDGAGELVGERSEATEVGGRERFERTLASTHHEDPQDALIGPHGRRAQAVDQTATGIPVLDVVQDRVPSWVVGAGREAVERHAGGDGHQRDLAVEDDQPRLAGTEQSRRLVDRGAPDSLEVGLAGDASGEALDGLDVAQGLTDPALLLDEDPENGDWCDREERQPRCHQRRGEGQLRRSWH